MISHQIVAGNDDLLTEILLRLPIRSLLRFKSVSKHWLSLISNPTFSLLRNSNPNLTSGFLLQRSFVVNNNPEFYFVPLNDDDPPKPPFRSLNFVNEPCGIRILQSCNGLLLCCYTTNQQGGSNANFKSNYYIYNPTINKLTTLPDPNRRVLKYHPGFEPVCAVNIAFDPAKSPHYKAVCVYSSKSHQTLPQHYEIEIYSSETRLWTPSGDPFEAHVNFRHPVYWNDSIHWISTWGDDSLYFNLNTESIETMPMPTMPDNWDVRKWYPFVGESGGHLHLIVIHGPQTTHFIVYEMERDYSNWFVKYHVDLDSLPSAFPDMIRSYHAPSNVYYYAFIVFDVVHGDKDEDSFLVLGIPGKAIRYNFVDKTLKKLCDFSPDKRFIGWINIDGFPEYWGWVHAFQFIESLASV